MKADATVTFLHNENPEDPVIPSDSTVFSIPYSKIMQAKDFCKSEELDYCYLGFKKSNWYIQGIPEGLNPIIKITERGIHPEVTYLYCLTEEEK